MKIIKINGNDIDISYDMVLAKLHLDEDDEFVDRLKEMIDETKKIAVPAAMYSPFTVKPGDNDIKINNININNPFVYKMLCKTDLVVPYVATCGKEIDQWSKTFTDYFEQYAADTIKYICLSSIRNKLFNEVKDTFFDESKDISSLNPGSLKEWPLVGQLPLFQILGTVTEDIGVSLSESLLMSPNKSVSGIYFQPDEKFENCQLCPRANCPNRREKYLEH